MDISLGLSLPGIAAADRSRLAGHAPLKGRQADGSHVVLREKSQDGEHVVLLGKEA